jgi:hypothetical protein
VNGPLREIGVRHREDVPRSTLALLVLLATTASCELYLDSLDSDREGVTLHGPDGGLPADAKPQLAPEPILHYHFDDSLANDGTIGAAYAGNGTGYTFVAGRRGKAIAFDTTWDSGVVLPTQVPLSSGDVYTVGLWFREDAVWNSGGATQYLFDSRGSGGFQTYHGTGGNEALTTCSAAGCQGLGYSVGVWHHLLYRYDGSDGPAPLELFIDGELATKLPPSDVYFSSTQKSIAIGARTNMQVDDLRIYDQAFDDARQCSVVIGGTWKDGACALP